MKNQREAEILQNVEIAAGIFDMVLAAKEIADACRPGQFLLLYTDDSAKLLPRPLSICTKEGENLRIVYQVLGGGTKIFSEKKKGERVKVVGPLGNGFTAGESDAYVLAGGGIGVPPLLELARRIRLERPSAAVTAFLGFRSQPFLHEDFVRMGVKTYVSTETGAFGFSGNVIDAMNMTDFAYGPVYTCGPKPMLKAVQHWAADKNLPCQVSMEERMACGLGACVGCVVKIKNPCEGWEYKKVCKDGPVFDGNQVMWDD